MVNENQEEYINYKFIIQTKCEFSYEREKIYRKITREFYGSHDRIQCDNFIDFCKEKTQGEREKYENNIKHFVLEIHKKKLFVQMIDENPIDVIGCIMDLSDIITYIQNNLNKNDIEEHIQPTCEYSLKILKGLYTALGFFNINHIKL